MRTCRFVPPILLLCAVFLNGICWAADNPGKTGPFKGLGKTGNLEMLTRGTALPSKPHLFGALAPAENDEVDVELLGGANAAPRGGSYEMEYDDAKKIWVIYVCSKSKSGKLLSRTAIAAVAVRNQKLGFMWLKDAVPEKAGGLFNCGLNITVGEASRFLPFGPPQQIKPLTINLDSQFSRAILPADRLPAPELLQVQVTSVEGPLPNPTFEPGDTFSGADEMKVNVQGPDLPKIWFQVKLETKGRAPSVTAAGKFQVTNGPETDLTKAAAQRLAQDMAVRLKIVQKELTKKMGKRAKSELTTQVKNLKAAGGEIEKLAGFYDAVNKKAKIHFRIFTMIDGEHELTLMRTASPEPGE